MSKSARSAICQRRSRRPYFQPWLNTGHAGQRGHLRHARLTPRPARARGRELSALHFKVHEAWPRPVRDDRRAVKGIRDGNPRRPASGTVGEKEGSERRDGETHHRACVSASARADRGCRSPVSPVTCGCTPRSLPMGGPGAAARGWQASWGRWAPRGLGASGLLSKGHPQVSDDGRAAETPCLQLQQIRLRRGPVLVPGPTGSPKGWGQVCALRPRMRP